MVVGNTRWGFTKASKILRRLSGTEITPTFGSIVQKGKFAASALLLEIALNKVDFPTFGSPTIPHLSPIGLKILNLGRKYRKKSIVHGRPVGLHCHKLRSIIYQLGIQAPVRCLIMWTCENKKALNFSRAFL